MGTTACGCSQPPAVTSIASDTLAAGRPARYLSLQDLLDVFDDFRDKVDVVRIALDWTLTPQEVAARIIKEIKCANGSTDGTVEENVKVASSIINMSQEHALRKVMRRIDDWKFDTTGRVDVAPKLSAEDIESMRLSQFDMTVIRQIAFPMRPSELHSYTTVFGLSDPIFANKDFDISTPIAIITVGAPGSGKDYITMECQNSCTQYLQDNHGGPPRDQYVVTDPDYWVSNLCKNKNELRDLGNFLNLEQFFYAVGRRHHIVFNGTGKDVKNTLGRVTSRLKEAKYRIFFCVVLARFSTVIDRIETRKRKTGRDVPTGIVRATFEGLQKAVPLYLEKQADIADAIIIYDNSGDEPRPGPKFVVSSGESPKAAIDFAYATLALPAENS